MTGPEYPQQFPVHLRVFFGRCLPGDAVFAGLQVTVQQR